MTTREPVSTLLVLGVLLPLYRMDEGDIQALAADLKRQVEIEYVKVVQSQLNLYGCQRLASLRDPESVAWIERYAADTSAGIARTYNRELQNEIRRLYTTNPKGNRYYYMRGLDAWTVRRNGHKVPSIALNTLTAMREYARQRFRKENGITGRFVFVGPPPVCKKCMRLKALGPVSEEQARKYGDSQHVNCPHFWQQLIAKKIACETAWTG